MHLRAILVASSCLYVSASAVPQPRPLVPRSSAVDAYEGYAFLYFTGDTKAGENIYIAASNGNDALNWVELNGGQPILTSTAGTKGLRDPFIMRSHDGSKFFVLATDLSIGSGTSWDASVRTGSRYLEIWETEDLVTWSAQRHVLVSPATAGNTWAPEAYYDDSLGEYVVFWASSLYAEDDTNHTGASYNRMMYATTSDFVTFSEAQIWQDAGMSRIDSTVLEYEGVYYRFTKDDGAVTGCADIIEESSGMLTAQLDSWEAIATCIGKNAGTSAIEGPTIFKSNPDDVNGDKFYLFVDEYTSRGYIPLETADISKPNWKISGSFQLPTSPRHGTVLPITSAELSRINSSYNTKRARGVV
ncbi:glycosyl hydrolase [Xylaria sp. FL0043]|nr:glycosyl hydrolase [Xylaria sp. FL0043]